MEENKEEIANQDIIFRQFFDRVSCTYTYLLGCTKTKHALLIDPVLELVDRDLQFINELGLNLKYVINTHCHADHITGSGTIKSKLNGVKSIIGSYDDTKSDIKVKEGDEIKCGSITLKVKEYSFSLPFFFHIPNESDFFFFCVFSAMEYSI